MTDVPEIIDWRSEPDRVVDIIGPQILFLQETPALSRDEIIQLDQAARLSLHDSEGPWLENYITKAAASMRYVVEAAKFMCQGEQRPIGVRFGMDINNAVPGHPVIAFEPYIIVTGSGRYPLCRAPIHGKNQHKWANPLTHLFARSVLHHDHSFNYKQPNILDINNMAEVIGDITWRAKQSLGGEYHLEDPLQLIYKHPRRGVIALEAESTVSPARIRRAYGPWSLDGGPLV